MRNRNTLYSLSSLKAIKECQYQLMVKSVCLLFFVVSSNFQYNDQTRTFHFHVLGLSVCPKAFCVFWGISDYFYYKYKPGVINGFPMNEVHGNSLRTYSSGMRDLILGWVSNALLICADSDPASTIRYLPTGVTRTDLYDGFYKDICSLYLDDSMIPSESYFRHILKTFYPDVKIVRKNRLGVCDVCVGIEDALTVANNRQKQRCFAEKRQHVKDIYEGNYFIIHFNFLKKENYLLKGICFLLPIQINFGLLLLMVKLPSECLILLVSQKEV